jgi:uncharacterized membrane protein
MNLHPFLLFSHLSGVVLWVGGMFFAYVCLRPALVELFESPQRLRLWRGVFSRFFVWVWAAIIIVPISGLIMLGQAGFATAPLNWHLMLTTGLVMAGIFVYVATGPFVALQRAVDAEDWKSGGAALNRIRQWVGINLLLGLLTIGLATLGKWF